MAKQLGQTRADFERQRDRFLGEDEIAYRFGRAVELLRGTQDEVTEGFALAEETLTYDPYNVVMHRELAVARARAGDAERVYEHLSVCFDMGVLDVAGALADPRLQGTLTKGTYSEVVDRVANGCASRTRLDGMYFHEIAPNTSSFTALVWKDEDRDAVAAAVRKLIEAARRQGRGLGREEPLQRGSSSLDGYMEDLKRSFRLDQRVIGGSCFFGTVHQLFRDIAPYVDDVRFLMLDQVSAIDEVWIVDGAFHVCRHPFFDAGAAERAQFFEGLSERHGLDDPALYRYIGLCWTVAIHASP